MSRDPHWFSTIFGLMVIQGQSISGVCFLIIILVLLEGVLPNSVYPDYLNDLGNLLLTCVILWAYLSFAQFLVIWMGNKQDEIPWYVQRLSNGWQWVGILLLVLHFFVPFIVLLMREAKRRTQGMLLLCTVLFVLRYVDAEGRPGSYPVNPNGSQADAAGLCDASGRVLGLMPHPERHVLPAQHPRWTRLGLAPEGDGLRLFRNAVQYFQ